MSYFSRHRFPRIGIAAPVALLALAGAACLAHAQGANHSGGHAGDAIRCASGKPPAAIAACGNIIADEREEPESRAIALRNRGSYYQQQGDTDRAIADYSAALKNTIQRATLAKVHLNRGLMYFRKNDEAEALADYEEAIALDAKLASAYVNRAAIFTNRSEDDRALADLDKAAAMTPKDAGIYVSRGFIHARGGKQARPSVSSTERSG
jgi:tetratricopeptide (TPR) repeat protein